MSRNPHIDYSGRVMDQPKATAWQMADVAARRAVNPPPAFHATRDMPQCAWAGVRNKNADGTCVDCGRDHRAPVSLIEQAAE
jgi:hypothetical protein